MKAEINIGEPTKIVLGFKSGDDSKNALERMNELFERDTAMKPIRKRSEKLIGNLIGFCRKCKSTVSRNFCSECGQRIDWN